MIYWLLKIICYIPFWLLYPVRKKGNKLPKGKVVIIANHRSNADPLILIANFARNMHCVAKKELFKNKLVGWFFKKMKAIPIDRDNIDISTIKTCLKVLKDEEILTIFPEGTRNKTEEPLLEIKNGASVFAYKSNSPIVPIWFDKKPKLFRMTKLYIGEQFYITKENYENSGEIMKEKLLEVKQQSENKKTPV